MESEPLGANRQCISSNCRKATRVLYRYQMDASKFEWEPRADEAANGCVRQRLDDAQ